MMTDKVLCPLCQHHFYGRNACTGCGLIRWCTLLRCPYCSYEFVESSKVISLYTRLAGLFRRGKKVESSVIPLSEARVAHTYRIVSIAPGRNFPMDRLAVLGIRPGSEIHLRQKRPSYVLCAGETEVAMDDEIAPAIYVSDGAKPGGGRV